VVEESVMLHEKHPTKHEYDLWNSQNQKLFDAVRGLGSMLYEIGSTNLEESVDVLQDLILAHIRAGELADRHRREKMKAA
jgi:hypothetical protein